MDDSGRLKAGDEGDATFVAESFKEQRRLLKDVICQTTGYGKEWTVGAGL